MVVQKKYHLQRGTNIFPYVYAKFGPNIPMKTILCPNSVLGIGFSNYLPGSQNHVFQIIT
jgi:hypothetical protein